MDFNKKCRHKLHESVFPIFSVTARPEPLTFNRVPGVNIVALYFSVTDAAEQ